MLVLMNTHELKINDSIFIIILFKLCKLLFINVKELNLIVQCDHFPP